jgi:hypothetical protein
MADEVNVSFLVAGEPSTNVAAWRANPPRFLEDYKRVDESYESLVYESNVTTGFTKWATFGFGKTLYRMAFTFRSDAVNPSVTRVTALGQAPEDTVNAMGAWAAQNMPS